MTEQPKYESASNLFIAVAHVTSLGFSQVKNGEAKKDGCTQQASLQMNRKFQVFVSSTYNDMQAERQAAVQAILTAGHIPAGMELFAAGDKSQLDTIRRVIDQADVFMLFLGGRYSSI